jgi:hypothetical protein
MILLKDILNEITYAELAEDAPPIADYDQYIKSMNKSLGSKMWFLDIISPDCIVDFGCADGSLLKKVHEKNPEISLMGYDIDSGMEKRFKDNNPDIPFTSNWSEAVKFSRDYSNSCVLLSSVIHEVYSYSQTAGHGVHKFWKQLFGSGFKYIVIRDTIPDKIDIVKPADFSDDVAKVKAKVDPKYLDDFEKKHGPIDSSYRLFVRFILTYRYRDNWDRESLENYLPLSYSTLLRKIPSNYRIIDGANYKFAPIAASFKSDYDIELKVNTHLNLILQRG